MSKPNFKAQAKRKRELAKLDKRQAKDQKRALRKAERATPETSTALAGTARGAGSAQLAAPVAPPMTLAEASERWRALRPAKARRGR